jgi:2-dehydropantoate 2-reductase
LAEAPPAFQHVAVIGPGALGLCVAVRLAQGPDGPRVTVIDHDEDRARRLSGRAVRLAGDAGDLQARLPVVLAPREPVDLVILATKAPQAQAAARAAAGWIGAAPLVTLQNGLDVPAEVAEALPGTTVVVGVTYQAANVIAEGEVHHAANIATHLGYPGREPDATAAAVAALLSRAGLPAAAEPDITPVLWWKVLVNAALNPVAALAGCRNGDVAERPTLAALARALAEEGEAVARAAGIALPGGSAAEAALETARATAANRCSMLQDLEAGRPTEIEYLNGTLVRLAETGAVPVPANRAVTALVRQIAGRPGGDSPSAGARE